MNSKLAYTYFNVINPTINVTKSDVGSLPFVFKEGETSELVRANISISKEDWDSHETSWDFEENPLVHISKQGLGGIGMAIDDKLFPIEYYDLPLIVEEFKAYWEVKFEELHRNEEELNRQFIEIYGLQDELSPEVPLEEITILQQGEITVSS